MIHDPGLNQNLDQIKGQAENVWRTILEILKRIKETVKTPDALLDHLQIIFRDESEFPTFSIPRKLLVYSNSSFSCNEQHFFRVAGFRCWYSWWMHDWNVVGKKE